MGLKVILSKELKRVFSDRKMIFSMFITPVLVIAIMFFVIFTFAGRENDKINSHISKVYIQNAPEEFTDMMASSDDCSITYLDAKADIEQYKQGLIDASADLIIVFPEDFEEIINSEDKGLLAQVKTFYNPSEDNSQTARTRFVEGYIEKYRLKLLEDKFGSVEYVTIFAVDNDNPDMVVQDDKKAAGKFLGGILPYFIVIMLFAGAMGLGMDTIAGEKERGTMANLLISPVKRVEIIMGKVFGLAIVAIVSAAVYIISLVVAMAISIKNSGMAESFESLSISFTPQQILQLAILLIGIALLYVGLIAMVSLFARNVKEAQAYIMPLYIIVMVLGMITMYSNNITETTYLIPLYNTSIALKEVFNGTISLTHFITVTLITYGFSALLMLLMAKIINSEKIMLNA